MVKSAVACGFASMAGRLRASRMYACAVRSEMSQWAWSQSPQYPCCPASALALSRRSPALRAWSMVFRADRRAALCSLRICAARSASELEVVTSCAGTAIGILDMTSVLS